jgi:CheY-like chemotaxis protein
MPLSSKKLMASTPADRHENCVAQWCELPSQEAQRWPQSGGRATILIVEDDNGTREALREILGHAGYSVLSAENGMHALESVEATGVTPALILLDLAMPVMDGLAFLSQIPEHTQLARVPVIVMSGDSRAPELRARRPHNIMDVLPKPIDVSRMMELVRKHTRQPSRRTL